MPATTRRRPKSSARRRTAQAIAATPSDNGRDNNHPTEETTNQAEMGASTTEQAVDEITFGPCARGGEHFHFYLNGRQLEGSFKTSRMAHQMLADALANGLVAEQERDRLTKQIIDADLPEFLSVHFRMCHGCGITIPGNPRHGHLHLNGKQYEDVLTTMENVLDTVEILRKRGTYSPSDLDQIALTAARYGIPELPTYHGPYRVQIVAHLVNDSGLSFPLGTTKLDASKKLLEIASNGTELTDSDATRLTRQVDSSSLPDGEPTLEDLLGDIGGLDGLDSLFSLISR